MKVRAEAGAEGVFRLTLCGPRANALEPGILREFHAGLDALDASGAERAVIAGGRNFCSGGDVAAFFRAANPEAHADAVVPLLQDALRRMVEMPVIFAVAARGAITGGGAGLLFALAVLALVVYWLDRAAARADRRGRGARLAPVRCTGFGGGSGAGGAGARGA